jgi:hypothetical protein
VVEPLLRELVTLPPEPIQQISAATLRHPRRAVARPSASGSGASGAASAPGGVPTIPESVLRTTTFMLPRELFLSLRGGTGLSKRDALRFESGAMSLTRQILNRGLQVSVVGRDGVAYSPLEWACSGTYRSANQENLLVSDNRTAMYANAAEADRKVLEWTSWGGSAGSFRPLAFTEIQPLELAAIPGGVRMKTG